MNRAFSAGVGISLILGRCPRLEIESCAFGAVVSHGGLSACASTERGSYRSFSFGAVSGDHGLIVQSEATISSAYRLKSWQSAATSSA